MFGGHFVTPLRIHELSLGKFILLEIQGASRPSFQPFNCKHVLFVYIVKQNKNNSLIFPVVTSCPTKNLGPIGSAVLTFIGYKQTDKQTNKQTSQIYIQIDNLILKVVLLLQSFLIITVFIYLFISRVRKQLEIRWTLTILQPCLLLIFFTQ